MKRLFLALLLAFMSANADRLSDVEWSDLYNKCVKKTKQNACQTLVRNGLPNIKGCDKQSCYEVGEIYFAMKARQKALNFFIRACELDNANGCFVVAKRYEIGEEIPKNLTMEIKYFDKACKLSDRENYSTIACYLLAKKYYEGIDGYTRNFAKAKEYNELACKGGNPDNCFILGTMYYKGEGTQKDFFKAFKLFEKLCHTKRDYDFGKIQGKACERLGSLYQRGEGIKQNLPMAKKYFGMACDLQVQAGCASYKKLNEQGIADIKEESNFLDSLLKNFDF